MKKASILFVSVFSLFLFFGCLASMDQFVKKYPGYTVIGKETNAVTVDVDTWHSTCVNPYGMVKCSVNHKGSEVDVGVNDCAISCNIQKGDKWVHQKTGTEKETRYGYIVRLKSPAGEVVEDKVSEDIYQSFKKGDVIPGSVDDVGKEIEKYQIGKYEISVTDGIVNQTPSIIFTAYNKNQKVKGFAFYKNDDKDAKELAAYNKLHESGKKKWIKKIFLKYGLDLEGR